MSLFVVGAGGVGRETLDAVLAAGAKVTAFLDDALAGRVVRGLPVLRPSEAPTDASYVSRHCCPRRLAGGCRLCSTRWACTRRAFIIRGPSLRPRPGLGQAASCWRAPTCRAASRSAATSRCITTRRSDTTPYFGDFVSVYPGANVSGSVRLDDDVTVGSGAVVLQGLVIGQGAFVGAGAVVTRDVSAGSVMVGLPRRPLDPRRM